MRIPLMKRWTLLAGVGALALAGGRAGHSLQATPAPDAVPPLVLEDFETASLGARPYLWKQYRENAANATTGVEKVDLEGMDSNKALKFEYAFSGGFDRGHGIEVGPGGMALPGSLSAISMMVFGDNGKNAVGLRVRDRLGESFEWLAPVNWTGWKPVVVPMDPRLAVKSGTGGNAVLDAPLKLEAVRLARLNGGASKGEVMVDNLTAVCNFARTFTLYDVTGGAKPEGWKANRNRSAIGEVAESLVPRGGKDVSALKLEYEYENVGDASVEFSKIFPAGPGHGTLVAEVFGDGSNNVLRFRMLDGEDRVWQATWAGILVDWAGWKTVYIDTRTLRDPEGRDPTAAVEKFPVKFYSIITDDCSASDMLPGVESGRKGEIYLGRLLFCTEK
jgi:hypothetical protein